MKWWGQRWLRQGWWGQRWFGAPGVKPVVAKLCIVGSSGLHVSVVGSSGRHISVTGSSGRRVAVVGGATICP